jgi:hypothetical protein
VNNLALQALLATYGRTRPSSTSPPPAPPSPKSPPSSPPQPERHDTDHAASTTTKAPPRTPGRGLRPTPTCSPNKAPTPGTTSGSTAPRVPRCGPAGRRRRRRPASVGMKAPQAAPAMASAAGTQETARDRQRRDRPGAGWLVPVTGHHRVAQPEPTGVRPVHRDGRSAWNEPANALRVAHFPGPHPISRQAESSSRTAPSCGNQPRASV